MSEFIGKMKGFVLNFASLSLGLKLIISGLLGILTGSTLFGILAEYATYFHTLSYGVRPPVEGIDVIRPTITLFSFLMSVAAAVIFYLAMLILKMIALVFQSYLSSPSVAFRFLRDLVLGNESDLLTQFRSLIGEKRLSDVAKWLIITAILIYPFLYFTAIFFYTEHQGFSFLDFILNTEFVALALLIPTISLIGLSILLKPNFISWIALFVTLTFIVSSIYLGFNRSNFMTFLRYTHYGGGVPVLIERKCYNLEDCKYQIEDHLFLRTEEVIIFYDKVNNQFYEIPSSEIMSIRYLKRDDWVLPQQSAH